MFGSLRWSAWGPEYWAILGAVLSFAAMIALLANFDGKPVFTWNGVTLNAIVSILSVAMKAAVAYIIAECMAQWKWILFARQERPLIDFDRIDSATRGPLGSLRILLRTKGAVAVQFGAVLTLLAVALDPLAQQLIQLQEDIVFIHSSSSDEGPLALNSRAVYYSMGTAMVTEHKVVNSTNSTYDVSTDIPLSMQGAIMNGLSRSSWEVEQEALVQCPTSNCTFGQFTTLGICHRCSDVTADLMRVGGFGAALLEATKDRYDGYKVPSDAFALPNGHFIANVNGCPPYNGLLATSECENKQSLGIYSDEKFAITTYGTGNPNKTVSMKDIDTLLWSTSVIYPDQDALNKSGDFTPGEWSSRRQSKASLKLWPDIPLKATECALYYCVKHINSRVEGNQLRENITQAPGSRKQPGSWKRLDELKDGQPENVIPPDQIDSLEFDKYWSAVGYSELVFDFPDNQTEQYYRVSADSVKALSAHFQTLFRGNFTDPNDRDKLDEKLGKSAVGFNGVSFGPDEVKRMEAEPLALNGIWSWTRTNVTGTFYNLATSMTNEIRRNFAPDEDKESGQDKDRFQEGTLSYYGNVGRSTVLYHIVWPWIALHGVMLVSAALFLFLTLSNSSAKGDVPLWKSSSLAAIRHGRDVGELLARTSSIGDMESTARKVRVNMRPQVTEETKSWIPKSAAPPTPEP